MKKAILLLIPLLLLTLTGCTSTSNPGSTLAISGTITLPGDAGYLYIGVGTTEILSYGGDLIEAGYAIAAGATSANYSVNVPSSGTYYVVAALMIGASETREPVAGDKAGQYADGNLPAVYGQVPTGTPTAIVVGDSSVTGKDFPLNVTWGAAPPASSLTISGTVTLRGGIDGKLLVFAYTEPSFTDITAFVTQEEYSIVAADLTKDYSLNFPSVGTYYVGAVLYIPPYDPDGNPQTGDWAGQYSNGYMPAALSQTPAGDPDPIVLAASSATGKDFQLLVNWVAAP